MRYPFSLEPGKYCRVISRHCEHGLPIIAIDGPDAADGEKMGRYLVTGGCGFIGSHLCQRLEMLGHNVSVLDDLSTGRTDNISDTVELFVGDVADPQCVARAMAETDGCFHLAAVASVQRSVEDWLGTHRTNLTGTIAVFDAARRPDGISVPVVYASSAAVYGDNDQAPLSERSEVRPTTAYGADKLGCELHARVATLVHGVPTCGLRFFNVYGPRQDPRSPYSGVISIFVDRLLSGKPLYIFGDGLQRRDFVFVEDIVDHLLASMESMVDRPRIFNVCRGQGTSIRELARILGETIGVAPVIQFRPAKTGDILVSVGDPALSVAEFGIRASTTLDQGMQQTVDAIRPAIAA
jgi:UDP-glucose 4-epimerase